LPEVPADVAESAADGIGRERALAWVGGTVLIVRLRSDTSTGAPPPPPPGGNADQTVDARRFLIAYDPATWTARWEHELAPFHAVFYAPRP
jgi:hypothetical protein